jgi:hypothetical protein
MSAMHARYTTRGLRRGISRYLKTVKLHIGSVTVDWSRAGLAAGDAVLMDSTRLSNTFTCQPQQRNMYGRIFGGFLMRRAYELAFATVHMFAGSRPRFVQVDRVCPSPRAKSTRHAAPSLLVIARILEKELEFTGYVIVTAM